MAYVLQIACTTLLAEIMLRTIAVPAAGFRYVYWRVALAAALVLPWLLRPFEPAAVPGPLQFAADSRSTSAAGDFATAVPGLTAAGEWSSPSLVWIAIAGACARLLWVAMAVVRLHRLRHRAVALHDPVFDALQAALGTAATLKTAKGVEQPVTFGLANPVVLVPEGLIAGAEPLRRAVLAHELVHVQRRDWLWTLAEEAVRSLFWFHPAVWWLLMRIGQAREEYTDHLAVLATGNRRAYMQALASFADLPRPDAAPAFARRAHLFHRILLLSAKKEHVMSSRRLVASGALLFGFVMLGAFYSSELFPLPPWSAAPLQAAPAAAQAAGSQQPHEVTPENPVPRRLFSTPIPYPLEFAGTGYEAAVDMRVVVDATGSVVSATRGAIAISDPRPLDREQVMDAFARAAADALRLWQYDPPAQAPLAFYVGVEFRPGAQATVIQSERGMGVVAGPSGARLGPVRATAGRAGGTAAAPPAQPARLDRGFEDTVTVGPNTVRIGGGIGAPTRTKHVAPVYPPLARAANVSGVVILELRLDQQGRVADARILRSIPLLDQAALDAVRQWEYTPVLLNGAPVSAIMTVTVYFTPEV